MKTTAGPYQVPSPSYVTQRDDGATGVITTAETVLSTAGAIKDGDAPKKIDFTCQLNADGAQQALVFRLYRDNVVLSATNAFTQGLPATTDIELVCMHWVDPSPGKATTVYEVRAVSTVDGTVTASGRTLTVHTL